MPGPGQDMTKNVVVASPTTDSPENDDGEGVASIAPVKPSSNSKRGEAVWESSDKDDNDSTNDFGSARGESGESDASTAARARVVSMNDADDEAPVRGASNEGKTANKKSRSDDQTQSQAAYIPPDYAEHRDAMQAPLRKLTVNLIKTYKHINEVYYEAKRKRQATTKGVYNDGYDDENYDYKIQANETLNGRYVVKQRIGKGSFGQVVRAYDKERHEEVAIKIIKSKRPFFRQAKTEIELLSELKRKDPDDQWFVVRLRDTFIHHHHQCLVFEMLSYNLYELLRNTQFFGVSLNLIRKFARQILKALLFLSQPDISIIHCDLKPENILLRHPKRSAIKVIDFGSSCKSNKRMYTYIQSRFYRSPEVILGQPYSVEIDMWSLGCILVEVHTGEPLFSGSDEHDQIFRIVALLGMPEDYILRDGSKVSSFFLPSDDAGAKSSWVLRRRRSKYTAQAELSQHKKSLEDILGANRGGPRGRWRDEPGHSSQDYSNFVSLIRAMLTYDPKKRIKPLEALEHPFFTEIDGNNYAASSSSSSRRSRASRDAGPAPKIAKRPGSAPLFAGSRGKRKSNA